MTRLEGGKRRALYFFLSPTGTTARKIRDPTAVCLASPFQNSTAVRGAVHQSNPTGVTVGSLIPSLNAPVLSPGVRALSSALPKVSRSWSVRGFRELRNNTRIAAVEDGST